MLVIHPAIKSIFLGRFCSRRKAIKKQRSFLMISLCSNCLGETQCVTAGGGNYKLFFGQGTKLNVENSEY